jgi:hypothetical protein
MNRIVAIIAVVACVPPPPAKQVGYTKANSSLILDTLKAKQKLDEASQADADAAGWLLISARVDLADADKAIAAHKRDVHAEARFEFDGKKLTLKEMVAFERDVAREVADAWTKLEPKLHAVWEKRYGATSDEAIAKLAELGKPAKVKHTKKGTCWIYEGESWCWTMKGKLAAHRVEDAGAAETADTGGETSGGGARKEIRVRLHNHCDKEIHVQLGTLNTGIGPGQEDERTLNAGDQVALEDATANPIATIDIKANTTDVEFTCNGLARVPIR